MCPRPRRRWSCQRPSWQVGRAAGGWRDECLAELFSSLLILLREAWRRFGAGGDPAFLRNTGQQAAARSVHIGWGLALAGVATWAVAAYLIDISGAQRELPEGATALFASVVLLGSACG